MKELSVSLDNYMHEVERGYVRQPLNLDNQFLSEPRDFSIPLEPTWPQCIPDSQADLLHN